MQKVVNVLILTDWVLLLGAVYDTVETAKRFLSCDVVTLPGQAGLAIVHSFVYGNPVITTSSASYTPELEYLIHGENGIKVSDNSLDAYAEAMKNIYFDEEYRKTLSLQAGESAKQLTMHKMAQKFRAGILYAVDN